MFKPKNHDEHTYPVILNTPYPEIFRVDKISGNTIFDNQSKGALEELDIPALKTTIKTRVAYKEAIIQGLGVYEYRDKKAKEEMTLLVNEVLGLLTN